MAAQSCYKGKGKSRKMRAGCTYDRKKGRVRQKDPKRVRAAKKAWKKRSGYKHSAATRSLISRRLKESHKSGKNKFGKKLRKVGRPKGSKDKKPRAKRGSGGSGSSGGGSYRKKLSEFK